MLNEITRLQIPYLQKLDYIDLKNLCRTDKYYHNICQDKKLKEILYSKNKNAIAIDEISIKETLDELDDAVENFYYQYYPKDKKLPAFINRNLLKDHVKRVIYDNILEGLYYTITDNFIDDQTDILDLFLPDYNK